jgi:hypothetical protein
MKRKIWSIFFSAAVALLLAAAVPAQAAPIEEGDAGPFFQGGLFQETAGLGELGTISGSTVEPIPPGEPFLFRNLVDVYSIRITDPDNFYATTDPNIDPRASASGDSRLFLMNAATGDVLLMNDDTNDTNQASLVAEPATYTALTGNGVHSTAQAVDLVAGGTYLLAITQYAITAIDLTGPSNGFEEGFPLAADAAYEGPPDDPLNTNTGAGGNLLLTGSIRPATGDSDWGTNLTTETGIEYVVALRGATYAVVPEPGTLAIALLALLGGAVVAMRRKLG